MVCLIWFPLHCFAFTCICHCLCCLAELYFIRRCFLFRDLDVVQRWRRGLCGWLEWLGGMAGAWHYWGEFVARRGATLNVHLPLLGFAFPAPRIMDSSHVYMCVLRSCEKGRARLEPPTLGLLSVSLTISDYTLTYNQT